MSDSFDDSVPTVVSRRCPGCAGEFKQLDDDVQPPDSHAEAWRPPVICRGTNKWFWCKKPHPRLSDGRLVLLDKEGHFAMEVTFFPERRLTEKPVVVERRRPKG